MFLSLSPSSLKSINTSLGEDLKKKDWTFHNVSKWYKMMLSPHSLLLVCETRVLFTCELQQN